MTGRLGSDANRKKGSKMINENDLDHVATVFMGFLVHRAADSGAHVGFDPRRLAVEAYDLAEALAAESLQRRDRRRDKTASKGGGK